MNSNSTKEEEIKSLHPNTTHKTNNKLLSKILIALIILNFGLLGFFSYRYNQAKKMIQSQQNSSATSPSSNSRSSDFYSSINDISFQIGNFIFFTNKNSIWTPIKTHQISSSYIEHSKDDNLPCAKVGNIHHLFLDQKIDNYYKGETLQNQRGFSPNMFLRTWKNKELSYLNDDIKSTAQKRLQSLDNVFKLQDTDALKVITFSKDYDSNNKNSDNQIDIATWRGLTSCGGYFSLPIYFQKVNTDKFDQVVYLEAFQGHDLGAPEEIIAIKHSDSYLILTQKYYGDNTYDEMQEIITNMHNECAYEEYPSRYECYANYWDKNHRNKTKINTWIEDTLNSLTYVTY